MRVPNGPHMRQLLHFLLLLDLFRFEVLGGDAFGILPLLR